MKNTIVVDTSAVLAVLLGESQKRRLESLTQGADLSAPASLKWELGNALSAMFKRRMISLQDSERVLDVFHEIPIHFVEIDIASSLKICHEYGLYAYDAYMIVCAQKHGAPFVVKRTQTMRSL